ncbi:retrovirus-related Pol polyprotein from transposon 17.6 [Trichonephila clavata]|uniref:Retrovirus-related Pol polyprotein from transposon 17.6 n=1 Tax=Trichonephila clavata TaxID=2740835 RepID=A0A8X6KXZ6_TRICU|nr:retrovirus-related Pol polyprotein from transposon 17.6 [Trichonephila clavata]
MFKLDTGSQVNVIPKSELLKLEEKPAVRNDKTAVLDYSDNRVPILDTKNGFWQLPLDEESSYLTTFCTPWGRYRFLVLPFCLNFAPEEFQKAMDEIYEEDEDINPYFDDFALGSSTVEEHCRLLRRTLLKARKANLKFNELKTQLSQTSVNYLGHVLSDERIKPDPKKIRAIEQFATPNCKEDLQRFLGKEHLLMIDYLSKYIELKPLNSTTEQSVIIVMKSIYATHGIPEDLVSYGGQPFNSNLMINFFREWGIKHHVTPPHFSRANGQIERAVQTEKNSLTKAAEEGKDLYVVLLDYRIQPAKYMPSPAELLMGRKLRTFLPSDPGQLKPTFDVERAREALRKRQIIQNKYAN